MLPHYRLYDMNQYSEELSSHIDLISIDSVFTQALDLISRPMSIHIDISCAEEGRLDHIDLFQGLIKTGFMSASDGRRVHWWSVS